MTRDKDFKVVVREYAKKTGRSYASARQQLVARGARAKASDVAFKDVEYRGLSRGFSLKVPGSWSEITANSANTEWAHFRGENPRHNCIVFRGVPTTRPDAEPEFRARAVWAQLAKHGFENFELAPAKVGTRQAALLTFDMTRESERWFCREYFFLADDGLVYTLGLGTFDPEGDADLFDEMAAHFEVTTAPPVI